MKKKTDLLQCVLGLLILRSESGGSLNSREEPPLTKIWRPGGASPAQLR